MQLCKYSSMPLCNITSMNVYASMKVQVCNYGGMQMQVGNSTHVCNYASIQVHNCAGISVCKFAIYIFIDARKQIWRYVCMKKYASM